MTDIEHELLSESHERSTQALSRIDSHEKVCIERYNGINNRLIDIDRRLNKIDSGQAAIYSRMWRTAVALVSLLIGVIGSLGFLIAKFFINGGTI